MKGLINLLGFVSVCLVAGCAGSYSKPDTASGKARVGLYGTGYYNSMMSYHDVVNLGRNPNATKYNIFNCWVQRILESNTKSNRVVYDKVAVDKIPDYLDLQPGGYTLEYYCILKNSRLDLPVKTKSFVLGAGDLVQFETVVSVAGRVFISPYQVVGLIKK